MKHLKLRGTWLPAKKKVEVKVFEQTHRGIEFAENYYGDGVFRHGTTRLFSCGSPEFVDYHGDLQLFLRGACPEYDDVPVYMSPENWATIKEAVEAYNKKYA